MVGTHLPVGPGARRRPGGGTTFFAGIGPAGGASGLQRVPVAEIASAGWCCGARPGCARTPRWRSAILDRDGNAGGRASTAVRIAGWASDDRVRPHSVTAPGRSFEVA